MATTLYRKYRPTRWADVVGQEQVVRALTNELARNSIVHAYLFTGPRGVGKTTSARLFAKAINCTGRGTSAEPCQQCEPCVAYTQGSAIDIIEIDAASHTGVDMVREHIIENARFLPTRAAHKVFIIDEVHMLSTSAFNALLKTLEEPPAHALFILATTEVQKLLATIRSRCEEYTFRRVGHGQIVERLQSILQEEQRTVAGDVVARIASLSEGCLRDAESLLGQVLSLKEDEITLADCEHVLPKLLYGEGIAILQAIAHKDAHAGLMIVSQLCESSIDFYTFLTQIIELTHAITLLKYKATSQDTLAAFDAMNVEALQQLAQAIAPATLVRSAHVWLHAREATPGAPLPQVPLELAIVELCDDGTTGTPQVHTAVATAPSSGVPTPHTHTVVEKITHAIHKDLTITLEQIRARWGELVQSVVQNNSTLGFIFKMAEPTAIEGCRLVVEYSYSLHADKLREIKTKRLAEDVLKEFYGERIELDCVVKNMVQQGAPAASEPVPDAGVAALAAAFGGEVIE